jgi:hypothetical protein
MSVGLNCEIVGGSMCFYANHEGGGRNSYVVTTSMNIEPWLSFAGPSP